MRQYVRESHERALPLQDFLGIGEEKAFFLAPSLRSRCYQNWNQYRLNYIQSAPWIFMVAHFLRAEEPGEADILILGTLFGWSFLIRTLIKKQWRQTGSDKCAIICLSLLLFPVAVDVAFNMCDSHFWGPLVFTTLLLGLHAILRNNNTATHRTEEGPEEDSLPLVTTPATDITDTSTHDQAVPALVEVPRALFIAFRTPHAYNIPAGLKTSVILLPAIYFLG